MIGQDGQCGSLFSLRKLKQVFFLFPLSCFLDENSSVFVSIGQPILLFR